MFSPLSSQIPCQNCGEVVHQTELATGKHQCVAEKVEDYQVRRAQLELSDVAMATAVGKWGLEPSIAKHREFVEYLREHEEGT